MAKYWHQQTLLGGMRHIVQDLDILIETVPHYVECYNSHGRHETSIVHFYYVTS